MACPICDQKPANCDCTDEERRQYGEIEDLEMEVERLMAANKRLMAAVSVAKEENAALRAMCVMPPGMKVPHCES